MDIVTLVSKSFTNILFIFSFGIEVATPKTNDCASRAGNNASIQGE